MNAPDSFPRRRSGKVVDDQITLSHGSGGKAMRDLIDDLFVRTFDNPMLATLEDQARIDLAELTAHGNRLAMTTDSYVVTPLFFPGGDIGKLAVAGTVNDLAVSGARPLYLTCGMILEEGLPIAELRRVVASMQATAVAAGVRIVTGDTKVVPRGGADKLFINTAGIGIIPHGIDIRADRARPGDVVLINGHIGDHGAAIVDARGELALESGVESDCQPLGGLIAAMLTACPDIHCMRDATRGGVATVLSEFAQASRCAIRLEEDALPIREAVRGVCEILGLDPLYLANEGKIVAIVAPEHAEAVLAAMRAHPAGRDSRAIGTVREAPKGTVVLATHFGGDRRVDMLFGDQLPRIC
ncbi:MULTISPECIES: hydrogenase expression/formation protein HypE [unclassified Thiomonas]|uniref:Carbamoyl phosphate phosphatase, hydrogenase 3 maturation protein n=1 Tax=mine drainage metagenome TaxID=410659 RepID=E6PP19_9ZZZZ|nr:MULTISPECIES: hydrogenase expression/formation protein HypE [unclassified Thiomonas]CQR43054.1 carbamoyl phosphate phosphatase, hydrogenase 3 maturation protein [Thiomonas sp. CB3]CDW93704.1 carbamoyl phosphate phosphatase, hydrogenase 3 maturation protein [Thiomonas sp. CB2]VDY04889.1 carbamoyl phosphate phosphatase, hydrogenase 3 maturation protein [Thiomonas sp. Bio17B3]VDY07941.1 carbamoyl phosphate phosphatase, hydrogenase 3 maturation protein [Thiomonas sp. Sup16B3]VDY13141.1 Hydrogen